jgi:hypothetical protein
MFTEAITGTDAESFAALIGVPLVSTAALTSRHERDLCIDAVTRCQSHLFMDPDTGVCMRTPRKNASAYISVPELTRVAADRPERLTLVFDQCLSRGREARTQLQEKLAALADGGVTGFAYVSHACFLLVGCDDGQLRRARRLLTADAHLPAARFEGSGGAA